jgi:two-component system nitrate/nitrite response regulator NarL
MNSIASREPVRIVIASEHPILRDGLRRLLESRPGHTIAGESAGAPAAVVLVHALEPDILLLGAPTSALDTVEQVAALGLSVRTIVLTPFLRDEDVIAAIRHGARGVMSTQTAADVLFQAIEVVMTGGIWTGLQPAPPNSFGLTPREMEILRAVVKGETNKGIASRCSISENTVKRHVMHLFDKVGASSRVELALFAQHHELTQGV